jgi:hypothetical protein
MHLTRIVRTFLLFALPMPFALAAQPDNGPRQESTRAHDPSPAPAAAFTPAFARAPAAASTLEQLRGGSERVAPPSNNIASDTQLRGTTDNNVAINVVTGNNAIQSSFSNAAGIPVVIQNSGANVLIQNATVVNLQFK